MTDNINKHQRAKTHIQEDDPFLEDLKGKDIIFGKYKPITKIGKGSFGNIYSVIRLTDKSVFAMKVEKRTTGKKNYLNDEVSYLYNLQGFGIPKLISCGKYKQYSVLIETLLGKSLQNIFVDDKRDCKLWEACFIGIELIDRLKWIHSNNFIYRDVRLDNILMGLEDQNVVYIIDFGLCKKYKSSKTGKHIKKKYLGKFFGNFKFASLNVASGFEASRRDDLISLGYLLIFLVKKELPWPYEFKDSHHLCKDEYLNYISLKKNHGNGELFKNVPDEFVDFVKYSINLRFEEDPDYSYLNSLLYQVLSKNNWEPDKLAFSWIKFNRNKFLGIPKAPKSRTRNMHKRLFSNYTGKYPEIEKSTQKTNNLLETYRKNEAKEQINLNPGNKKNIGEIKNIKKKIHTISNNIIINRNNNLIQNYSQIPDAPEKNAPNYFTKTNKQPNVNKLRFLKNKNINLIKKKLDFKNNNIQKNINIMDNKKINQQTKNISAPRGKIENPNNVLNKYDLSNTRNLSNKIDYKTSLLVRKINQSNPTQNNQLYYNDENQINKRTKNIIYNNFMQEKPQNYKLYSSNIMGKLSNNSNSTPTNNIARGKIKLQKKGIFQNNNPIIYRKIFNEMDQKKNMRPISQDKNKLKKKTINKINYKINKTSDSEEYNPYLRSQNIYKGNQTQESEELYDNVDNNFKSIKH
jgi:serine/threonine protein kinase